MIVTINGKKQQLDGQASVGSLIEGLNLCRESVVIEYNGKIIDCSRDGETSLKEGDCLEIVQFVGGG